MPHFRATHKPDNSIGLKRFAGAFTLIELLIVVAIIAILAAIALPNFFEAKRRADQAADAANLKAIAAGLATYSIDFGSYPLADGVVGPEDTRGQTIFGEGPAANGLWSGVPNVLANMGYVEDRRYLFSPTFQKMFPARREYFRYAYNAAALDAGGFTGASNNTPLDGLGAGERTWVCRSLYVNAFRLNRDRYVAFPFGELPDPANNTWGSENVLWNDFSVTLEEGAKPF